MLDGLAWTNVGSGPPLVVVHGGPGMEHAYLRPGLDAIGAFASVVYYDLRGVGASVPPGGGIDSARTDWNGYPAEVDTVAARFDGGAGVSISWRRRARERIQLRDGRGTQAGCVGRRDLLHSAR